MRFLLLLAFLSGCAWYKVDPAQVAAVGKLPRYERTHAAIPAERLDGTPVYVRGAAFSVKGAPDARGKARARAIRPMTIGGIVLMVTGAAWLSGGTAMAATANDVCAGSHNDACGPVGGGVGISMAVIGGIELFLGLALTVRGATSIEVPQPK